MTVAMSDAERNLELVIYRATLIPRCFNQPAPPSLEARRAQAAHLAQARFDTLGLPRGLAVAL